MPPPLHLFTRTFTRALETYADIIGYSAVYELFPIFYTSIIGICRIHERISCGWNTSKPQEDDNNNDSVT